jgi:hypothetical protein
VSSQSTGAQIEPIVWSFYLIIGKKNDIRYFDAGSSLTSRLNQQYSRKKSSGYEGIS